MLSTLYISEGRNTFFEYILPAASKHQKTRFKTQINNTLEVDKIYFKLGSNLHVLRETTNLPYILLYGSCYLCSI